MFFSRSIVNPRSLVEAYRRGLKNKLCYVSTVEYRTVSKLVPEREQVTLKGIKKKTRRKATTSF